MGAEERAPRVSFRALRRRDVGSALIPLKGFHFWLDC